MQSLNKFNDQYPGLFGTTTDDSEPLDEGASGGSTDSFNKRYGWIYSTRKVADFENISMELTWELPIIQTLNDLAYLKAKDAHDKELIKNYGNKY